MLFLNIPPFKVHQENAIYRSQRVIPSLTFFSLSYYVTR